VSGVDHSEPGVDRLLHERDIRWRVGETICAEPNPGDFDVTKSQRGQHLASSLRIQKVPVAWSEHSRRR
jgi:hypothetical protein